MTTRLFVYGTLKRGHCRAWALDGQRFLGEARTLPRYRMYDCGWYPGLVEASDGGVAVVGELWEVDAACLAQIDEIECVSVGLYRRGPVKVQPPFDSEDIETYYYIGNVADLPDCGSAWIGS